LRGWRYSHSRLVLTFTSYYLYADLIYLENALERELSKRIQSRANHPLPFHLDTFYFEVAVMNSGHGRYVQSSPIRKLILSKLILPFSSILGVGVCEESAPLTGMPGWRKGSWGYHSDDGNLFAESGSGIPYGPTYQTGDIVGCGGTMIRKTIFFTKNGLHLG
jgi:hypothetical protein